MDFVWVFVSPDNPYNFAMIPPRSAAAQETLDLKPAFYKITKWIWLALFNR